MIALEGRRRRARALIHTMQKTFLLRSALLLASASLTGCFLTRVSDSHHAREVEELQAVGFTIDQARASATQKGYACDAQPDRGRTVRSALGDRKTDILRCSKTSAELICPQRRYVVFNIDPESGRVREVGQRITQKSCF